MLSFKPAMQVALLIILTLLVTVYAPCAMAAVSVPLPLRPEVSLSAPVLRFGDLLTDEARAQLRPSHAQQAANVVVARIGLNAAPFYLQTTDVLQQVQRAVPQAFAQPSSVVKRKDLGRVHVVPVLQPLPTQALLAHAQTAWEQQCKQAGGVDCAVQASHPMEPLPQVPLGQISFVARQEIRPLEVAAQHDWMLAVRVDGVGVGTVPVRLTWHAKRDAWQLRRSLARAEAVSADDLVLTQVDASQLLHDAIVFDAQFKLLRAARDLPTGTIIPITNHAYLAAIKRGQAVPVRFELGQVQLTRSGTALHNAVAGQAALIRFGTQETARVQVPALPSAVSTQTLRTTTLLKESTP